MRKTVDIACSVVLCFAIMVFIITFSIGLPIYIRPFYYMQIEPLGIVERTGHTYEEIRTAYDEVMDYLTIFSGGGYTSGVFPFTESGADHFRDVKGLFTLNIWLLIISAVVIVISYIAYRKKVISLPRIGRCGFTVLPGVLLLLLFLGLGVFVAIDFEKAFDIFHEIFFRGKDNWILKASENGIVRALPDKFFLNCAILIGSSIVFSSIVLIICGVRVKQKSERQDS